MPELPEVEIAARNLRRWTAGRSIVAVESDPRARRIFRPGTPARLARAVVGARIGEVGRIGKQLLIHLEKEGAPVGLASHLGMTGKWLRRSAADAPTRFSRARLALDDGSVLHYDDLRLFGRLFLVPGARFEKLREVKDLGPDPLHHGIDPERLAAGLARSRLPVKVRMLDQKLLAGVGNIIASESLWRARIDPRRPSREITRTEAGRLAAAVLRTVNDGIASQDASEIVYVEEGGENPFIVYAREGERCPRCRRGRIVREVQAGRSTYFCPRCQR